MPLHSSLIRLGRADFAHHILIGVGPTVVVIELEPVTSLCNIQAKNPRLAAFPELTTPRDEALAAACRLRSSLNTVRA